MGNPLQSPRRTSPPASTKKTPAELASGVLSEDVQEALSAHPEETVVCLLTQIAATLNRMEAASLADDK